MGLEGEELLCGSVVEAETGDDLVDDEQGAILFCDVAKAAQKIGGGRNDAHIGSDGLDDYGSDFVFVLIEDSVGGTQVVVVRVERQLGKRLRNSRAIGDAERGEPRAGLGEEAV